MSRLLHVTWSPWSLAIAAALQGCGNVWEGGMPGQRPSRPVGGILCMRCRDMCSLSDLSIAIPL